MRRRLVNRALLLAIVLTGAPWPSSGQTSSFEFNDSHFHLTNYIQEGTDIRDFLKIMGNKAGRVALFGIPLQQQWSYRVDRRSRAEVLPGHRRPAVLLLIHRCLDRHGLQVSAARSSRRGLIP